ncbi:nesprin-2 [Hippocampus comes]|uniref:nesprin-2 n=1 Tax=Hippocampus comes TaxID=109280 RepID=UPI00094F3571|nr:PREDICTED: nesprin-2 [Hippocampus comes]
MCVCACAWPQHARTLFHRQQCNLVTTLEVGGELFSASDRRAQDAVGAELATLRDEWDELRGALGRRLDLARAVVQIWERCEAELEDETLRLKATKAGLDEEDEGRPQDVPDDWADGLGRLSAANTDLSQYVMADDDVLVLRERVGHLRCHWEELCLKVSLRKQEIGDRLNAWMIFKEKNAELCDWLARVENKMADASQLNIEEMVEKLKKDCVEEMNLFGENKSPLKQLGEQLIRADDETEESHVGDAVCRVDDRWRHLFRRIEARVTKLKETLLRVQQLDKNMSNLRSWLSRVEADLSRPITYSICHHQEIQRRLAEQQELQRDIEQHTEGVTSVLNLCDLLLRDEDAAGTIEAESDSLQETSHSLDQRWRTICAMSLDRRLRIEETWRLWCKFLEDYSQFEDWLKTAEKTAANPNSGDVPYAVAKEELKKFERFQRQLHERLTQLELLNEQYRRLARENRTDGAGELRLRVDRGNRRWDDLRRRAAAVLRRLKHLTSQREDFEGRRQGILAWLTEMDLQLTDAEHFSDSDAEDKMRRLKAFRHEITLNAGEIDALIVSGENLIRKSAPLDAALIQDQLEELHSYCQEVFGRAARFHRRLLRRRLNEVPEEEEEREGEGEELPSDQASGPPSPVKDAGERRASRQPPPPDLSGGRETPVGVDSVPLEWDHAVDVGGSSSHEDGEDAEEAAFFGAPSAMPASDAAGRRRRPVSPPRTAPGPKVCSAAFDQRAYVKLMSECSGSIDDVKRVKSVLGDDRKADPRPRVCGQSVMERWEVVQAREVHQEVRRDDRGEDHRDEDPQRWRKLQADLRGVTSWLDAKLPELEALRKLPPAAGLKDFEDNVRTLKETQRAFCVRKRALISLNLAGGGSDGRRPRELKAGLGSANRSWMRACGALERWEAGLHAALTQCQDFHESLRSLLSWLAQAEQRLCAVDARRHRPSRAALSERRDALQVRERRQALHAVGNKMELLLRRVHASLAALDRDLKRQQEEGEEPADDGQVDIQKRGRDDGGGAPPGRRPLLQRVLRAALPLHALFFLLLALGCLVAPPDEWPSPSGCSLANNFARSFSPMLRYTNGPPPT